MHLEDKDFERLRAYMYNNYGINLEKKRTLIEGRLSTPLQQAGFANFHDYINDILSDTSGEKVDFLLSKLTTNYTYFMREEEHFHFMTNTALPEWTKKITNHDLRIWSAACSSGEEPYTISMVLDEYFGVEKPKWDSTILATDLSPKVLAAARKAVYPDDHVEQLSPQWQKKYFKNIGPNQWQIVDRIRKEIVYQQFNLMNDFSRFKKKFHIIFCRNCMIYFDNPTKSALSKRFYSVLEPGGYLFIGLSETLSGLNTDFKQIAPAIYKKEK